MSDFGVFCNTLLEESKWLLENSKKVESQKKNAYQHASLLLSISALEAFINGIADDFAQSSALSLLEKSLLLEKDITFDRGEYELSARLKISRLTDKIEFLYRFFSKTAIDKSSSIWWSNLQTGIDLRNKIVHPKEMAAISLMQLENTILAVINCVDDLFKIIYKRGLPDLNLGLQSKII